MRGIMAQKLLILCLLFGTVLCRQPVVVIDPAGHAGDVGRWLVEGCERAETLQCAQELKKRLEACNVKAVISRSPCEEVLPLQIPSFSNRLGADFFLRINMYREESEKPKLFLYHLLFDPFVDISRKACDMELVPLYQAHCRHIAKTMVWGDHMYKHLNQDGLKKHVDCFPLRGIPLKHLVGIVAPSLLLEIGMCRENKWRGLIDHIADSLSFLYNW